MSRAEIESIRSSLKAAIEKDNKTEIVHSLDLHIMTRLIVTMR